MNQNEKNSLRLVRVEGAQASQDFFKIRAVQPVLEKSHRRGQFT